MPSDKTRYKSLLKDEGFSKLTGKKIRRLIGLGLSEMIGTAFFLAMGCGGAVSSITGAETSILNLAIGGGTVVAACILIFGPISGAFMNPTLNLTAVILGHMSLIKFVYYTICQLLGSYLGVMFIRSVSPPLAEPFCVTLPSPDVGVKAALVVEIAASAFLSFGLCHVLDSRMAQYTHLIGIKYFIIVVAAVLPTAKYSGCSMNAARSFGAALSAGYWEDHWIYWIGPFVGAILASLTYRLFFDVEIFEDNKPIAINPPKEPEAQQI